MVIYQDHKTTDSNYNSCHKDHNFDKIMIEGCVYDYLDYDTKDPTSGGDKYQHTLCDLPPRVIDYCTQLSLSLSLSAQTEYN